MDAFFQPRCFDIPLPHLDKACTVLHFSDVHLCIADEQSTAEERTLAEIRAADWMRMRVSFAQSCGEAYDAAHILPDYEIPDKYLALAQTLHADAVVCTGDLWEAYLSANERFTRRVLRDFPIPFLWARGNHEADINGDYASFMNGDPSVQTLSVGKLKLIVLDNCRKSVTWEQLARIRKEAEDGAAPVLCYHIPLRTEKNREAMLRRDAYYSLGKGDGGDASDAFLDWLTEKTCPVTLTLAGHLHEASDTMLSDTCRQIVVSSALVGNVNIYRFHP